jgi:Rrf2 family cysteine metabolism transcriptional repressor
MYISTKGRYGIRALLDLSVHAKDTVVTLSSIAERQKISEGYLEQVFSLLRKANIVTGLKGPQGGYLLSRPAKEIKIKQVLETLEGDIFIVKEEKTNRHLPDLMEHCIHKIVWRPMVTALTEVNESLTLQDLIDEYEKESGTVYPMYYI